MTRVVIILTVILLSSVVSAANFVDNKVPFSSQAPLSDWSDPKQQDACEEASALMAMAWVEGIEGRSKLEWLNKIIELSDFQ